MRKEGKERQKLSTAHFLTLPHSHAIKAGAKVGGSREGLEGFLKFVGGDFGLFRVRQVRENSRPRDKPPTLGMAFHPSNCLANLYPEPLGIGF